MHAQAQATIDIHAPLDRVWRLLTELAHYGDWNPFIVGVESDGGALAPGQKLTLQVVWPDGSGRVRSGEQVTRVEPPAKGRDGRVRACFAYRYDDTLSRLGLVRAEREQQLTTLDSGVTRYYTRELFHGPLVPLLPLRKVRAGFDAHARALCARAQKP